MSTLTCWRRSWSGVPDDKWGERPLAAVVIREGHSVTAADLRAFLDGRVAHWQVPERWTFIAEVPRRRSGKSTRRWYGSATPRSASTSRTPDLPGAVTRCTSPV